MTLNHISLLSVRLTLFIGFLLVHQAAFSQEWGASGPGWSPVVFPSGAYRDQIKSMPIEQRPYRPFHFYGNTIRRSYYRGTEFSQAASRLASPIDTASSFDTLSRLNSPALNIPAQISMAPAMPITSIRSYAAPVYGASRVSARSVVVPSTRYVVTRRVLAPVGPVPVPIQSYAPIAQPWYGVATGPVTPLGYPRLAVPGWRTGRPVQSWSPAYPAYALWP